MEISTKTIDLYNEKLAVYLSVIKEMLPSGFSGTQLTIEDNYLTNQLVLKLTSHVYIGKKVIKTTEIPINWFEHFKQDKFPVWLLNKFPVKYEEHTFELSAIFPDLTNLSPEFGEPQLRVVYTAPDSFNF